jgi:hypothetical protein
MAASNPSPNDARLVRLGVSPRFNEPKIARFNDPKPDRGFKTLLAVMDAIETAAERRSRVRLTSRGSRSQPCAST